MLSWRHRGIKRRDKLFRALNFFEPIIEKSYGSYIVDTDGKKYLDFASGQFCALVGHSHPRLVEAITEQAKRSINLGSIFLSDSVLKAADLLSELTPRGLEKSIFLSTGTEGNEFALRLSKSYNKKPCVVTFDRGYHGSSFYTGQLSPLASKAGLTPEVGGLLTITSPYCFRCPLGMSYPQCKLECLTQAENKLRENKGKISAFIVEPILSAGGMIVPPPDYFRELSNLIRKHDALLIADEAQTGLGRTGKWFGFEHWNGVIPDILVLSKGAGGGYPVSIVLATAQIEKRVLEGGFWHASSHMNDPLAAAAFSAVIEIIKKEELVKKAEDNGRYLKKRLMELKEIYRNVIGDVRGIGLMLGVELIDAKGMQAKELAGRIGSYCFDKGLIFGYTPWLGVFRLCLPLTASKEEIDQALSIFEEALRNNINSTTR